jgi:hypothetical protein
VEPMSPTSQRRNHLSVLLSRAYSAALSGERFTRRPTCFWVVPFRRHHGQFVFVTSSFGAYPMLYSPITGFHTRSTGANTARSSLRTTRRRERSMRTACATRERRNSSFATFTKQGEVARIEQVSRCPGDLCCTHDENLSRQREQRLQAM